MIARGDVQAAWEMIIEPNGSNSPSEDEQHNMGRSAGIVLNLNWYACQTCLKNDGVINYAQYFYCCSLFKMIFCREKYYVTSLGRIFSFFNKRVARHEEHSQHADRSLMKSPFPQG